MASRIGQKLGNYCLTRLLGAGGFAEVYLGKHMYLDTYAAIKVLHTQLMEDDIEIFRREAYMVAHLLHPNIIRVFDFGIENKTPFLVMDYALNGTLRHRHPKGTHLALQTVNAYIQQITLALQYAHDQRIIHCDVKPENLFVGSKEEILLGDFGIALVAQSTRTPGMQDMAGTVAYMAPEQLRLHPCPASDQYSLGIIVYEWLTGERPFNGTFAEIAFKQLTMAVPPLHGKVKNIPSAVEDVITVALAKDAKQRFVSMKAFAVALDKACRDKKIASVSHQQISRMGAEAWVPTHVSGAQPDMLMPQLLARPDISQPQRNKQSKIHIPKLLSLLLYGTEITRTVAPVPSVQHRITRRRIILGLATLGGISMIGTGSWLVFSQVLAKPTNLGITMLTYTGHSQAVYAAAWSPDGKLIASGGQDDSVRIWNASNGSTKQVYVGHEESVNTIACSPDKTKPYIASAGADTTVQIWDSTNLNVLVIYRGHQSNIRALCWSPDGMQIASGDDEGKVHIWKWDTNGQEIKATVISSSTRIWAISWSPDGAYIAWGGDDGIVRIYSSVSLQQLYKYEGHRNSKALSRFVKAIVWSPDSMQIASGSDDHTVHIWDISPDSARSVLIYRGHTEVLNGVSWSADGKYIASGSGDHTVQIWDPATGENVYTYQKHTDAIHTVSWSPDSRRIASSSDDRSVRVWRGAL